MCSFPFSLSLRLTDLGKVDLCPLMVDPAVAFSADDPTKLMVLVPLGDALSLSNPKTYFATRLPISSSRASDDKYFDSSIEEKKGKRRPFLEDSWEERGCFFALSDICASFVSKGLTAKGFVGCGLRVEGWISILASEGGGLQIGGMRKPLISNSQRCEMAFRNFISTEDDDDLAFLPKELYLGFGIVSPSTSVNTELPKSIVARIQERKCKTRGDSSRPLVKRKLASGSSSSSVVRAKTSASEDDAPILSIFDDDEGKFLVHLVLSKAIDLLIYPLSSLYAMMDNAVNKRAGEFLQVIKKMSGETDVNKARERSSKEECEELRVKCQASMAYFDQNPAVLDLRQKISSLTADVKEHKGNLDRMMLESQKWVGYQVTLSALESKVDSLEAEKARLEVVEASLHREVEELRQDRRDVVSKVVPYAAMKLVHSDELGKLVGTLVSSAITYGRCRVYEQVAAMKEPFDLSKTKGYRSSYKTEHTQASNDFRS
ncbi:hypothetical protein Tco_1017067 [Tanacetum coccineum]|uniref:Uncharacterized protein n=1 Tax=Tanacetum coccineum TaxID=301880 RepID=A0ABQ5FT09_9ASTR